MLSLLLAIALATENAPTRCATADVVVSSDITDKTLTGCGPQYPDNVLWHRDVADGVPDSIATRVTTGRGAVVYVVDTGVEALHDEFRRDDGTSAVIAGIDPIPELTSNYHPGCAGEGPMHPCFIDLLAGVFTHGTAVASVVAGRNCGIAPDAKIVAARTFATNGTLLPGVTNTDIFIHALDGIVKHAWSADAPPFHTAIVNMSNMPNITSASDPTWPAFEQRIRTMIGGVDANGNPDPNGKRFLFVVIAGNNVPAGSNPSRKGECAPNNDVLFYPAAIGAAVDGLITVGGIDEQNALWSGSCTGAAIDILAPASHMLVASISAHDRYRGTIGGFDYTSGTSYAAPYVAGIAARLLETDPSLTPQQLEQRIKENVSFVTTAGAPAGGRCAILNDRASAPPSRHHHAARH